jgi:AcrR family transcriptional regulator
MINMAKRAVGRPSIFNESKAKQIALDLFWRKGYEETSLNDLTENIGINRSSFYRSFESKEKLFRLCVQKYIEENLSVKTVATHTTEITEYLEFFFRSAVNLMTQDMPPRGCLLVQGLLNCGHENKKIAHYLSQERTQIENLLRKRIQQAQIKQQIKEGRSAVEITKMLMTVYCGLSVQASSGASKNDLYKLIDLTIKVIDL